MTLEQIIEKKTAHNPRWRERLRWNAVTPLEETTVKTDDLVCALYAISAAEAAKLNEPCPII